MDLNKTCRKIAKELGEDFELVKDVVQFQFYFITQIMKDDTDTHDIMLNELFKFKLKKRYKENKQYKYSSK